jgi:hypothetical protein
MYGDWARLSAQVSKMALDVDLDERLLRNSETTVLIVGTAIDRAISAAQMDFALAERFRRAIGRELRKLAEGGAAEGLPVPDRGLPPLPRSRSRRSLDPDP